MAEPNFPPISSRFVPKDAPPSGAIISEVTKHKKESEGYDGNWIDYKVVKNLPPNEIDVGVIGLDYFNKNYKLI